MKSVIAVLLCLVFPLSAFAAENGYKIGYDGGSIANAKAGQIELTPANLKALRNAVEATA